MRERLTRVRSLVGLGGRLVAQRLRHTAPRRTAVTILGIAFAVALCLTVSGVSVAIADQGSVAGSNVDYWIVPEGESSSTLPVSVGGPRFGDVHAVADRLTSRSDVVYASPVSMQLLQLSHRGTTEYVIVAGVVAHDGLTVAGVNTSALTPGDPHYENGTYDGPWTGEVVISDGAGALLNATPSDSVTVRGQATSTREFTVAAVTDGGESGFGDVPVAVMHLSELQTLTGATTSDTADQILVASTNPNIENDLAGVYAHSDVVTRSDTGLTSVTDSDLALALAAAGFIVALVVGVLFVATTLGLEVTTDRRLWATLSAIGFSARSRAFLLFAQIGLLALVGGVLGVILGRLGVFAANTAVGTVFENTLVAVYPIEFVGLGLTMALVVAVLTTPYLLWLTTRGTVTDTLKT